MLARHAPRVALRGRQDLHADGARGDAARRARRRRAGRWKAPLGWLAAAALALAVVGSDALAYHAVQYAPTERMDALRDLDRRLAGQGPILFNEPEEFAKNFMGHTRAQRGARRRSRPGIPQLRVPQPSATCGSTSTTRCSTTSRQYPIIVFRRSPAASRPPADFRASYRNAYYEVWRAGGPPKVLEHLPLQRVDQARPPSRAATTVQGARGARRPGEQTRRRDRRLDASGSTRCTRDAPPSAGARTRAAPGRVQSRARRASRRRPFEVRAGRALPRLDRRHVRPRDVEGLIDGRRIGSASGVNTSGSGTTSARSRSPAGSHELDAAARRGDAAPGDGYSGELGPLVLERDRARDRS